MSTRRYSEMRGYLDGAHRKGHEGGDGAPVASGAVNMAWHERGPHEGSRGGALLLHGFMGCGDDWRFLCEAFSPPRRCLCPDLPGHGDARHDAPGEGLDLARVAAALVDGLDAREMGRCTLAGYSMGGRLALYLGVHYPERFRCLVVESASPGLSEAEDRRQRQVQDGALAKRLEAMRSGSAAFEAFVRAWYRQPLFHTLAKRPESFEALVRRRLVNHPPALAGVLTGLSVATQTDLWDRLAGLRLPTLLLVGEYDRKYRDIAAAMMKRLPEGCLAVVAGCSHAPHLEAPGECAEIINRFLRIHGS